jgi:protein phosphatase 2C-like protein
VLRKIAKPVLWLVGVREPNRPQGQQHQQQGGSALTGQPYGGQSPAGQPRHEQPARPAVTGQQRRDPAAGQSHQQSVAMAKQQTVPVPRTLSPASAEPQQPAASTATPVLEEALPPPPSVPCVDPTKIQPPTFGRRVPRAASEPWHLTVEPTTSGIAADQAKLGGLHVRAASIVGPSHRCEEPAVARQDSYRLGRDDTGRHLIVAVTDGMSDSRRSDIGAMVAARCAVDAVRYELNRREEADEAILHTAFQSSANAMITAARESRLSQDEVRCAMIVAILPTRPENGRGERRAWFGSVADVSAWLRTEQGWHPLAGEQKDTGMDRNQVRHFLPHYPNQVRVARHVLPPRATVTVVTDGVGDAFTDIPGGSRWFAERWRSPMPLESFLLDIGYHASGQLDDRTAVTVWCEPDDRR